MSKLDRLQPVELRDVWQDEAGGFTPWLAEEENLALLSETLGLEHRNLRGTEHKHSENSVLTSCARMRMVHGSSLKTSWKLLIISIWVQILTYAAGLDADTVIWIAENLRMSIELCLIVKMK